MGIRRVVVRASVLCVVGAALSVWSGVASAKLVHPFVSSFGSFSNVQGVATDGAGDVYAYDGGNGEVLKFDSTGKPVNFTFTGTNAITGVGSVGGAEGEIAVDSSSGPAKGDIYVAHGGGSINIYNEAGEKVGELTEEAGHPWGEACGVAVDSSGNVYVGLYPSHVNKYVPAASPVTNGEYVSSMAGLSEVCNVAADSTGNVFIDKWNTGPVTRYEPSQFGSLSATGSVVDAKGSTLAVDSSSDELYVNERAQIAQFGPHGEPFEAPSMILANSGEGTISGSIGVAVGPSNHDIYASSGNGKVNIYGPAVEIPTVITAEVSSVTHTEAIIAGSVNPEGVTVTLCQFEYGTTTSYGHTVSCPTNPGSGNASVEETTVLAGLEAGTEYHYRLATTSAGGPAAGADRTFDTAIVWPESSTGLPDGRLYELVSPPNKHGNEALNYEHAAFVSQDGQAALYAASGALGGTSSNSAFSPTQVSERTARGWVTRSALPLPEEGVNSVEENVGIGTIQTITVPSADLSHMIFGTWTGKPYVGPPDALALGQMNVYVAGPDPFVDPEWLGRPLFENGGSGEISPFGSSPNLKTIYFSTGIALYEYKEGSLSEIGALPNGEVSPGPAAPAALPYELTGRPFGGSRTTTAPAGYANQVSADGSRVFFVRKDEAGTMELYAYVTAPDGSHRTLLVSQSQLSGHVGEPAPDGPQAVASTERQAYSPLYAEEAGTSSQPSYVFASPDGSHAFFQSADRLTEAAPEDASSKTYDYDLETGTLEYLPGLKGSIVTVVTDGSAAVFENTTTSPFRLERWVAGPSGGTVTSIAQLPPASGNVCEPVECVGPAYTSTDSKTLVFTTDSPIAGFNDGGSHLSLYVGEKEEPVGGPLPNNQIFRYEVENNDLTCVSCPPRGVTPASNAITSKDNFMFNSVFGDGKAEILSPGRAMSPDGSTLFFETRDQLLPQDTNGTADVYEWHSGRLYLISAGQGSLPSYFTGISESGGDAFFMTADGMVAGDTDGSYDVYDARIPRPGDTPPPAAVPCEGAVCQGPPSVPQLLSSPGSERFNGAGDLTPGTPSKIVSKSLTRKQKLAQALRVCRRSHNKRKRLVCERRTKQRYGAKASQSNRNRRHNGRGK